ncbi:MAG: hypothetical protein IKJ55_07050 [Clostridia bacterium]|nr:hypothetical protein [Clostridia bacterium]
MKEKGFIDYIKSDLSRLCKPTFSGFVKQYFVPRGGVFPYIFWLRVVHFSRKHKLTKYTIAIPAYFIMRHFEFKYGIHANPNIQIGKGLHIVHGGAVYLNCKSIGENFTVYQSVTLGSKNSAIPTILDDVTVYTGAVVSGNVILNNGCVVGANSYVDKSVDAYSVVAGLPAKEIKKLNQHCSSKE